MAQLYYGCVKAQRDIKKNNLIHRIVSLFVKDIEKQSLPVSLIADDLGKARHNMFYWYALVNFPKEQGWYNHEVEIKEVPAKFVGDKFYEVKVIEKD